MPEYFSTEQVADFFHVKSNTILRALCLQGHYMGIVPKKMPNRRLLWSREPVEKVLGGEEVKV